MIFIKRYKQYFILEPQTSYHILHVVSKTKPVYRYRFLKL